MLKIEKSKDNYLKLFITLHIGYSTKKIIELMKILGLFQEN